MLTNARLAIAERKVYEFSAGGDFARNFIRSDDG
jgi:hypothetical protein